MRGLIVGAPLLASVVLANVLPGTDNQHLQGRKDETLVQPPYKPLRLGTIKPQGWFKDQLELEAAGLAGNMFEFYRFAKDSRWIGGSTEYSPLDEATPYLFNGLVPLAFGLDDDKVKGQVKYYLDYVIDHQQDDGWLGFETTQETRGLWARTLLLYGLVQYADADSTETERIVDAMHKYVTLAHSMLKNNYTGLLVHGDDYYDTAGFGVGRTHEYHITLQWLYENYPRNNSDVILETLDLMIDGGVVWGADWRTFWVDGVYPTVLYDDTPYNLSWVFIHGVNHAEGMRYPLSIYRMTHDEALKKQTRTAVDLVFKYHKSLAGTIVGDEYISDLNPARGSELCIAAELMFSLTYIYQFLADNDIADWVEQTAFNALPGSLFSDWWSHQYVQQINTPWARNLTEGSGLWSDVNSYANVFGEEPNYPCCTVNHPQAYPKFLANSFVTTEDGGLAHVYLIAGTTTASLGDNLVSVSVNTTYPFGMDLEYTISAEKSFSFYVRIPGWATSHSTVDGPQAGVSSNVHPSDRGLQQVSVPAGTATTFSVHLDAQPRVVELANNTAAIYYGALLYALAIDYDDVEHAPLRYYDEVLLNDTTPQTHDHYLTPKKGTQPWNVAIDPSQIEVVGTVPAADEVLANPIWELGGPPVELRVAAVEIEWPLAYDMAAAPPLHPKVTGKPFSARFVPFGSAKLHMAQLPAVKLPKVNLKA